MAATDNCSLHIILIDDDDIDAEAVARLLAGHHLPYQLTIFPDGCAAQLALSGAFGSALRAGPYLILLDLNMPRMNGFEFLDWLQGEPAFANAPVFIVSTSDDSVDRCRALRRHIAGYLAKAELGPSYIGLLPVLAAWRSPPALAAAG